MFARPLQQLSRFASDLRRPRQGTGRIDQLDGLRGILSLQVAFFHLLSGLPLATAWAQTWARPILNHWIAVDIFFTMSGFVMGYVYAKDFEETVTARGYRRFILARFARIYPVHIVTMALLLGTLLPFVWDTDRFLDADGRYSWQSAIAALFLLQGPFVDHLTWNYPAWSVSVEWVLYFAFPFLVGMTRGRTAAWTVIIVASLGALALYMLVGAKSNGWPSLLRGALLFSAGFAIYRLRDLAFTGKQWFLVATIAAFALVWWIFGDDAADVVTVPAIVMIALANPWVAALLSTLPLRFLGVISYSLYMIHAFVQIVIANRVYDMLAARIGESTGLALSVVLFGIALSIVLAVLSVVFIEQPAREAIRRYGARRQARLAAEG